MLTNVKNDAGLTNASGKAALTGSPIPLRRALSIEVIHMKGTAAKVIIKNNISFDP